MNKFVKNIPFIGGIIIFSVPITAIIVVVSLILMLEQGFVWGVILLALELCLIVILRGIEKYYN